MKLKGVTSDHNCTPSTAVVSNAAICLILEYFPCRADVSPSLHLGEINCDESVGQSPLGQIPAVTSNVDGHIVT